MRGMATFSISECGIATETSIHDNIYLSKSEAHFRVPRASIADLVVEFPLGQDIGNLQVDRSLNFLSISTSGVANKYEEEYVG